MKQSLVLLVTYPYTIQIDPKSSLELLQILFPTAFAEFGEEQVTFFLWAIRQAN